MIKFTNVELELLRMLADNLCQVVELEPNESEIINKFYQWLDEQQKESRDNGNT